MIWWTLLACCHMTTTHVNSSEANHASWKIRLSNFKNKNLQIIYRFMFDQTTNSKRWNFSPKLWSVPLDSFAPEWKWGELNSVIRFSSPSMVRLLKMTGTTQTAREYFWQDANTILLLQLKKTAIFPRTLYWSELRLRNFISLYLSLFFLLQFFSKNKFPTWISRTRMEND